MAELPIACELNAEDLAQRAESLVKILGEADLREPVTNGFRWRFRVSGPLLDRLFRVVNAERVCCRFLRFQVTVEPGEGPVWLEASGPPGTAEFLTSLLAP